MSFKMKKIVVFLLFVVCVSAPSFAQHSVALSWNAGVQTTQVVTSYNIYKSATSNVYTFTAPIAAVPATQTTYTDNTVKQKEVWYYVAEAVCLICLPTNSVPSNQVGPLTIPNDPSPVAPSPPILNTPVVK